MKKIVLLLITVFLLVASYSTNTFYFDKPTPRRHDWHMIMDSSYTEAGMPALYGGIHYHSLTDSNDKQEKKQQ